MKGIPILLANYFNIDLIWRNKGGVFVSKEEQQLQSITDILNRMTELAIKQNKCIFKKKTKLKKLEPKDVTLLDKKQIIELCIPKKIKKR